MSKSGPEQRVLVLMPDFDSAPSASVLDDTVQCTYCADLAELVRELGARGAAALLVTEDVVGMADLPMLTEALRYQPPWSDLPILLLSEAGAESASIGRAVALLGNVTVLERPVRGAVLVSALRTAIRARERQYELRAQIDALRQSEERFELATQATHDAIWDLSCNSDKRGKRKLVRTTFGWGAAAHRSGLQAWTERLHPEDRERVVASLTAALDGTATLWNEEYRFRGADGGYLAIVDRGQILRTRNGDALRAVGAMTDVTARQRSEEARTLHAAIVESSDDAIISKTLDGTIRSWNAGAEGLFGWAASEAIGRPITLIVPRDRYREEADILRRIARGERIDHFETTRVAKDGQLLDISLTVSPLIDGKGRVFGASKVARDITARKRARRELEHREAQLRLLWESASVLLTSERPDTMLRGVFEKIAGYLGLDAYLSFTAADSGNVLTLESSAGIGETGVTALRRIELGSHLCGVVAATRRPLVRSFLQQSADSAAALFRELGFRAYVSHPLIVDSRLLGVLSFATRSRDELAPTEIEFLGTICHYVTAAYERVSLIRRLQDADNRKDEFLATLAHELRNPLAPIRNAIEIMRVDAVEPSAVAVAARTMIERQLEHLVRLVDDLLDVSRITRGRLELRKERVTLASVMKSAIDTSRPLIEAARHELSIELPEREVYLDADPVRLAQVFANLLNNAARYTDDGGRIAVVARREGDTIVASVRDTGVGIAPEALPSIFDMFIQVDETGQRSQSGLGIGLTLVKRLVELHGGSVEARSAGKGRGTELVVRLPVACAAATAGAAPPPQREHAMTHRILVADDNRDAAESMGMLLRLMGNEVRTVYDGLDAVEEAEEFRPDVILLDIGMPRLNGYDAARQIRGQRWSAGTMLVALTGWGQIEDKRRAAEAGFDRHFTKPLDPAELQKLITDFHAP
jgi:PAS domain S-box-containing protein